MIDLERRCRGGETEHHYPLHPGSGGVGVAASWAPLSGLGAADRPAEPRDALSPAAKDMVRRHEFSPDGPIGTLPVTFTVSKTGPAAPHVVVGAAIDDVISVSFNLGGERVTVPVEGNFYAWEGEPSEQFKGWSALTVTFADGTTREIE